MSYMETFRVIGLMSGTSLDGLDIADVVFSFEQERGWQFELLHADTVPYPTLWKDLLATAVNKEELEIHQMDIELSEYYATCVNDFLVKNSIAKSEIDLVSAHGHTIFHQPQKGITLQIGNRSVAAKLTGLTWVCDFRKEDVQLGGNGAPLVPVGDHLLFKNQADAFLNLGGFSNVSFSKDGVVRAYDICPVNLVLNNLVFKLKAQEYDQNGEVGRKGNLLPDLLNTLNNLVYYQREFPKSLGVEWLKEHFYVHLPKTITVDVLTTCYHHIAHQISRDLNKLEVNSVLVTGGGAKNTFLMELIASNFSGKVVIPSPSVVDFKEAIVFGFLGVLRLKGAINVYASVTGARKDSCSGVVHLP